jgi:hypothetical protein
MFLYLKGFQISLTNDFVKKQWFGDHPHVLKLKQAHGYGSMFVTFPCSTTRALAAGFADKYRTCAVVPALALCVILWRLPQEYQDKQTRKDFLCKI